MSFVKQIKKQIEILPPWVGSIGARIPYSIRPLIGKTYRKARKEMKQISNADIDQKRQWVLDKMRYMVGYAIENVPFYRTLYGDCKVSVEGLKTFEDIQNIPIINKQMLKDVDIEQRSACWKLRYKENTGGSSGNPLSFYICQEQMGVEWAHMHRIWQRVGFRQYDLKLGISGRNLQAKPVSYDALRHHYSINVCLPWDVIADELSKVLKKTKIQFLHGYPSAIYDFACYCEESNPELVSLLKKSGLRGAMLGSEYPNPVFRNKMESVFGIQTVSWYGHTERCVLAGELEKSFVYQPFLTYGFTEGVKNSDNDATCLIGTSFYNFASPFIRYNTEDEIKVTAEQQGIVEKFEIAAGRQGDYVQDKNGKKIPLTALIFGRHHKIFDHCTHLQIGQDTPGQAVIYVTTNKQLTDQELESMFDASYVDIDFKFCKLEAPVLTKAGKLNLKISSDGIDK